MVIIYVFMQSVHPAAAASSHYKMAVCCDSIIISMHLLWQPWMTKNIRIIPFWLDN